MIKDLENFYILIVSRIMAKTKTNYKNMKIFGMYFDPRQEFKKLVPLYIIHTEFPCFCEIWLKSVWWSLRTKAQL